MNFFRKIKKFLTSLSPKPKKRKKGVKKKPKLKAVKSRTGATRKKRARVVKNSRKVKIKTQRVRALEVQKKKSSKKSPKIKKAAPLKKTVTQKKLLSVKSKNKAEEFSLGTITHYFPKVHAAVLKLEGNLKLGEKIMIKRHDLEIIQKVNSMQINRIPIDEGRPGEEIGIEVKQNVFPGDKVYIIKK